MKRFFVSLLCMITLASALCATALAFEDARPETNEDSPYETVVDAADVLTDAEEKAIYESLLAFRDAYELELVIVTTNGVMPDERMAYADDFYDYNGYGYGENRDGALLLVNVQDDGSYAANNSWISTCGAAIGYLSDESIQEIGASLTPLLTAGRFSEAFGNFPNLVGDCIDSRKNFKRFIFAAALLIVSIVAASIRLSVLKGAHKSVFTAAEADSYLKEGSLQITKGYDHFLYSTLAVSERSSSSSGSSTHTSSSGTTHGGGGF